MLVEACGVLRSREVPFDARDRRPGRQARRRRAARGSPGSGSRTACACRGRWASRSCCASTAARPRCACRAGVLDDDRDGIPNVLVEAMAAGTPVVATSVSGIPELVDHDVNGLLVPPDDPEALADMLLRAARRSRVRGAARRRRPRDGRASGSTASGSRAGSPGCSRRPWHDRRRRARGVLRDRARAPRPRRRRRRARRPLHRRGRDARARPAAGLARRRAPGRRGVADRVGEVRLGARPRARRRRDRRPRLPRRLGAARRVVDRAGPARPRRAGGDRAADPQLDLRRAAVRAPTSTRRVRESIAAPGAVRARQPRSRAQPPHARAVRAVRRGARAARAGRRRRPARVRRRAARPEPGDRLPAGRRALRGRDALPPARAPLVRRHARERAPVRRAGARRVRRRLARACAFAAHCCRPDGTIPALSDSDTGDYRPLLALAAELLADDDLRYVASDGRRGTPPAQRCPSFPDGGYFIQRSGWGDGTRRSSTSASSSSTAGRSATAATGTTTSSASRRSPAAACSSPTRAGSPTPRSLRTCAAGSRAPPRTTPSASTGSTRRRTAAAARTGRSRPGACSAARPRTGSTCSRARRRARPTRRSTSAGSRSWTARTG